ncbi:Deoxyribodipyrimidine photo-lyase type II [Fervidobacterium pennivorans DSM 9078]|uniref:Deoxyribodipyrimidine photo-lyase n=1 Tax=Fervidobacterium pennivorans (strain DSM 9078 / Ven5) TaxID=771875 RepID=H9UDQ6_FERPD|nr:deoxyribodipyrimidine photo-lyase [Fervidobacterium pennivorans]AFG35649.1 Deoxyribodipyrimidine photo-lyase type II [Fervidobacterium pennivorans DSM 9078]
MNNEIFCDFRRIRVLKQVESHFSQIKGPVVYWMQRDQRAFDNWALLYAQQLALKNNVGLLVVFNIVPSFLNAPFRHYDFMLQGLFQTKVFLEELNVPLVFTFGEPVREISKLIKEVNACALVTDFNPLKIVKNWKENLIRVLNIPVYEVDAHNIVPAFFVSQKQEYGAYTLRPKIKKYLKEFLTSFPAPKKMPVSNLEFEKLSVFNNFEEILKRLDVDGAVAPVNWLKPGFTEGMRLFEEFSRKKLKLYKDLRNDPTKDVTSNLSAYLHFGQIAPQRVALEIIQYERYYPESVADFLEELIVRRELADNFCLYNENYDSFDGFPEWAKKSLNAHRNDKREYIYSLEEFEKAKTHDDLWNAAQIEMVKKGKMHGYLRMYWAKKILEWTRSPEDALKFAIYLNDKYELDGRDPNGYTGIAWAIGGVHDRPWAERPIFGMVRYMSYEGCKRKFSIEKYIQYVENIKNA